MIGRRRRVRPAKTRSPRRVVAPLSPRVTTSDVSSPPPTPSPNTFTVPGAAPPAQATPAAVADPDAGYGSLGRGLRFAGISAVVSALLGFANALVNSRLYGVDVVGQYALLCTPWAI